MTKDLSGTITGLGVYFELSSGSVGRVDDLQVTLVPEPLTLGAMLGLGGIGLLADRRRRAG